MPTPHIKAGRLVHPSGRSSKVKVLVTSLVAALIALGLILGLGLGLTLSKRNSHDPAAQSPKPTIVPASSNTWQPHVNSTWQIILSQRLDLNQSSPALVPDVDVYDLDLFITTTATIEELHRRGKRVICYFSAGSYEPDRPDSHRFGSKDLGKTMDGWPKEKWIDLRSSNVRSIMQERIMLANQKGCDGVDPDNTDAYNNDNGLNMTTDDSVDMIAFLARTAQSQSLSIGLKNSAEIINLTEPAMQWQVNEQCVRYSECGKFQRFIQAGKPVFHIEYLHQGLNAATLCSSTGASSGSQGFSTLLKQMDLNNWVQFCDGSIYETLVDT